MKKILVIAISIIMSAGLFAACGQESSIPSWDNEKYSLQTKESFNDLSSADTSAVSAAGEYSDPHLFGVFNVKIQTSSDNTAILSWDSPLIRDCDVFRIYRKDGRGYSLIEETTENYADITLEDEEYEYCVTVYCKDNEVRESEYSEPAAAPKARTANSEGAGQMDLSNFYASDFLNITFTDLRNYSGDKFKQYADCYISEDFPGMYFYGSEYTDLISKVYIVGDGIPIKEGIVSSSSLMTELAEKYGITKCRLGTKLKPAYYSATASISVGDITYTFLFDGIFEFDPDGDSNWDQFCIEVDNFYRDKVINISDLKEFVVCDDDLSSDYRYISRNDQW